MKISGWDILAILFLLASIIAGLYFLSLYLDPSSIPQLFNTPTLPATISIPTSTRTPFKLPPTWTATVFQPPTLRPSSTPVPTRTGFVLPSFTPTNTPTYTPTVTHTMTETRTVTMTPTTDFTATFSSLQTAVAATETALHNFTPTTGR